MPPTSVLSAVKYPETSQKTATAAANADSVTKPISSPVVMMTSSAPVVASRLHDTCLSCDSSVDCCPILAVGPSLTEIDSNAAQQKQQQRQADGVGSAICALNFVNSSSSSSALYLYTLTSGAVHVYSANTGRIMQILTAQPVCATSGGDGCRVVAMSTHPARACHLWLLQSDGGLVLWLAPLGTPLLRCPLGPSLSVWFRSNLQRYGPLSARVPDTPSSQQAPPPQSNTPGNNQHQLKKHKKQRQEGGQQTTGGGAGANSQQQKQQQDKPPLDNNGVDACDMDRYGVSRMVISDWLRSYLHCTANGQIYCIVGCDVNKNNNSSSGGVSSSNNNSGSSKRKIKNYMSCAYLVRVNMPPTTPSSSTTAAGVGTDAAGEGAALWHVSMVLMHVAGVSSDGTPAPDAHDCRWLVAFSEATPGCGGETLVAAVIQGPRSLNTGGSIVVKALRRSSSSTSTSSAPHSSSSTVTAPPSSVAAAGGGGGGGDGGGMLVLSGGHSLRNYISLACQVASSHSSSGGGNIYSVAAGDTSGCIHLWRGVSAPNNHHQQQQFHRQKLLRKRQPVHSLLHWHCSPVTALRFGCPPLYTNQLYSGGAESVLCIWPLECEGRAPSFMPRLGMPLLHIAAPSVCCDDSASSSLSPVGGRSPLTPPLIALAHCDNSLQLVDIQQRRTHPLNDAPSQFNTRLLSRRILDSVRKCKQQQQQLQLPSLQSSSSSGTFAILAQDPVSDTLVMNAADGHLQFLRVPFTAASAVITDTSAPIEFDPHCDSTPLSSLQQQHQQQILRHLDITQTNYVNSVLTTRARCGAAAAAAVEPVVCDVTHALFVLATTSTTATATTTTTPVVHGNFAKSSSNATDIQCSAQQQREKEVSSWWMVTVEGPMMDSTKGADSGAVADTVCDSEQLLKFWRWNPVRGRYTLTTCVHEPHDTPIHSLTGSRTAARPTTDHRLSAPSSDSYRPLVATAAVNDDTIKLWTLSPNADDSDSVYDCGSGAESQWRGSWCLAGQLSHRQLAVRCVTMAAAGDLVAAGCGAGGTLVVWHCDTATITPTYDWSSAFTEPTEEAPVDASVAASPDLLVHCTRVAVLRPFCQRQHCAVSQLCLASDGSQQQQQSARSRRTVLSCNLAVVLYSDGSVCVWNLLRQCMVVRLCAELHCTLLTLDPITPHLVAVFGTSRSISKSSTTTSSSSSTSKSTTSSSKSSTTTSSSSSTSKFSISSSSTSKSTTNNCTTDFIANAESQPQPAAADTHHCVTVWDLRCGRPVLLSGPLIGLDSRVLAALMSVDTTTTTGAATSDIAEIGDESDVCTASDNLDVSSRTTTIGREGGTHSDLVRIVYLTDRLCLRQLFDCTAVSNNSVPTITGTGVGGVSGSGTLQTALVGSDDPGSAANAVTTAFSVLMQCQRSQSQGQCGTGRSSSSSHAPPDAGRRAKRVASLLSSLNAPCVTVTNLHHLCHRLVDQLLPDQLPDDGDQDNADDGGGDGDGGSKTIVDPAFNGGSLHDLDQDDDEFLHKVDLLCNNNDDDDRDYAAYQAELLGRIASIDFSFLV